MIIYSIFALLTMAYFYHSFDDVVDAVSKSELFYGYDKRKAAHFFIASCSILWPLVWIVWIL